MTLMTQAVMAENLYMRMRVSVEAAKQGVTDQGIDPDDWTRQWRKVWAAAPGWDTAWEQAQEAAGAARGATAEGDMVLVPTPLGGPVPQEIIDIGQDPEVITDEMIHDQVELMKPFIEVEYNKPEMNPLAIASRQFVRDQMSHTDRTVSAILMAVNELRGGEELVIPPPEEDQDTIWQDPRRKQMAITNRIPPGEGEASAGKKRSKD